jgi:hypothetical protein
MAWSYDERNLNTTDPLGRLNAVRFLIGDTDESDQQVQDEEIAFAMVQANNNTYYAGAFLCRTIAAKYSRNVDVDINGAISEKSSQLQGHYLELAEALEYQAQKTGAQIGVVAGGLSRSRVDVVRSNTDRVKPAFSKDQFKIDDQYYDYE